MLPNGWLGQLMKANDWCLPTDFSVGQSGNINIVTLAFLGCLDDQWFFTGIASPPDDHLHCCCLKSNGSRHECLRDHHEQVFLLMPRALFTEDQCFAIHQVSIRGVFYLGNVDQVLHFNGSLTDSAKVLCAFSEVMQFGLVVESDASSGSKEDDPMTSVLGVHSCEPRVQHSTSGVQSTELSPGISDLRASAASVDFASDTIPIAQVPSVFHKLAGNYAVFHVDLQLSTVCVRPHPADLAAVESPWVLAELFSGAFAGWKQASAVMDSMGSRWASTHAVEIDPDLAAMYQRSHHVPLMYDEKDPRFRLPGPVVAPDDYQSSVFVGDIRNMDWVKTLPWNCELIVCMSPPCPPWSPSSPKNGLEHEDGQLFAEVIAQLRFVQPRAVAVENVNGIVNHPHFQAILDVFQWAGYKLAWSCVSDLKNVAPVTRKRWLAVFLPLCDFARGQVGDLIAMPSMNLGSFGVFVDLPPVHEWELTLGPDLIEVYSDRKYVYRFHGKRKALGDDSEQQVLESRIRDSGSSLSTIMAHYGVQHLLPVRQLLERGLFTELCSGKFGIRFFSPAELAVLHGLVGDFDFPLRSQLGHKSVGNAIATPHAALALTTARHFVDKNTMLDPRELALVCLRKRQRADNTVVLVEDGFVCLRPKSPLACPPLPEPSHGLTVLDSSGTSALGFDSTEPAPMRVECSPTLDFQCNVHLACQFPFESHRLVVAAGTTLESALRLHSLAAFRDLVPVDDAGRWIPWDYVVDEDLTLEFLDLSGVTRKLLTTGSSWLILHSGDTPRRSLHMDGYPRPIDGITAVDIGLEPCSLDFYPTRDTLVFLVRGTAISAFFAPCLVDWTLPAAVNSLELTRHLPLVSVQFDGFYLSASQLIFKDVTARYATSIFESMRNIIAAASWTYEAVHDPHHQTAVCRLLPNEALSAPSFALHHALIRCFFQSALGYFDGDGSVPVKLKFNAFLCWEGAVPPGLAVSDFVEIVSVLLHCLDMGRVNWLLGGRALLADQNFAALRQVGDFVRLRLVTAMPLRLVGGGGKVDTWREVKALLGRELITQGWAVRGLDTVTTEWVRRIGQNKLFALLRRDLDAKARWTQLCSLAKEHNVKTTPDESNRSNAASTIQRALRKKKFVMPPADTFTLQKGFFVDNAGTPLAVLQSVDLHNSGVCLCDWVTAEQWLSKPLPIVGDELGILTLIRDDATLDTSMAKLVDFPAVDQQQRQVILKGHLWQLGEKDVKVSAHGGTISVPDTTVLAVTIWRDECSEEQWTDASKSLVRSAFKLLPDLDNKHVVEVWGRCFRDDKKRVPPEQALSGQFHIRLVTTAVDGLLKASKGPVYVTPKDARFMAHPGWSLLWFGDRMEAEIALTKVSVHAGLARARGRFALRVVSSTADQAIKELKIPAGQSQVLPVSKMFKIQPIPVGAQPADIVEWARALSWPVKVIKMLGRDTALIGTNADPPHPHLLMNGTPIMLKAVQQKAPDAKTTAIVAGPRTFVAAPKAGALDLKADPWGKYDPWASAAFGTGAASARSTSTASTGGPGPAQVRQVDAPTATKFQAIEARLAQFETSVTQIKDDQKILAQNLDATTAVTQKLDGKVSQMQQQLQASVETAIGRAMSSQTKALDAKFDGLMKMLKPPSAAAQPVKRDRNQRAGDSDAEMESPAKPGAQLWWLLPVRSWGLGSSIPQPSTMLHGNSVSFPLTLHWFPRPVPPKLCITSMLVPSKTMDFASFGDPLSLPQEFVSTDPTPWKVGLLVFAWLLPDRLLFVRHVMFCQPVGKLPVVSWFLMPSCQPSLLEWSQFMVFPLVSHGLHTKTWPFGLPFLACFRKVMCRPLLVVISMLGPTLLKFGIVFRLWDMLRRSGNMKLSPEFCCLPRAVLPHGMTPLFTHGTSPNALKVPVSTLKVCFLTMTRCVLTLISRWAILCTDHFACLLPSLMVFCGLSFFRSSKLSLLPLVVLSSRNLPQVMPWPSPVFLIKALVR